MNTENMLVAMTLRSGGTVRLRARKREGALRYECRLGDRSGAGATIHEAVAECFEAVRRAQQQGEQG